MPARTKKIKPELYSPFFEFLEQRLMLTTLHGGDFFLYHDSAGDTVRVDLQGAATDTIEIFANDNNVTTNYVNGKPFGKIVDMPGLLNGATQVDWPDGLSLLDKTGAWAEFVAPTTPFDPTNPVPTPRGSRAEIYSIYVVRCSAATTLTLTTLTGGIGGVPDRFASVNLPLSAGGVAAPAGSGGVIIGSTLISEAAVGIVYNGVAMTDDSVSGLPAMDLFPGGTLNAGITIAAGLPATMVTNASTQGLGTNVQAVAAVGTTAYAVDLSAYQGRVVSDGSPGGLGSNVLGLATSGANTYTVNNTAATTSTILTAAAALGATVDSLAVNKGIFYYVDESTHTLFQATLAGTTVTTTGVGVLTDIVKPTYRYDNIQGLGFNPAGTLLYSVATITDTSGTALPAALQGSFLITINTKTGRVTRGAKLAPVGGLVLGQISSMAWDPSGTIYAINNGGQLITIDRVTGNATLVGAVPAGMLGIASVYAPGDASGTLYGVTIDSLYRIDKTTGVATLLGLTGVTGQTSLCYDSTRPGYLFTTYDSGSGYEMARIGLGAATLESVNKTTGAATTIANLLDATRPTQVYRNISALSFSGATMYAVASLLDLNGLPNAKRYIVRVNTATGTVARVCSLSGVATLDGISFSGATLYGVSGKSLYTVVPATGVATLVGNLPAVGFQDIQFVTIGAKTALYGIAYNGTTSTLYDINVTNPSASIALATVASNQLTSLAYDATMVGRLWSTGISSGGVYRLFDIPLSSTLVTATATGVETRVGVLLDATTAGLGYTNVTALTFNPAGTILWGTGTLVSYDPVNVTAPTPAGAFLIQINTTTGMATRVGAAPVAASLASMAFNSATGQLYGVDPANNLVKVDTATAQITSSVHLSVPGVVGIDFVSGTLYAVTGKSLYTVNTVTGVCTLMRAVGFTGLTSLSAIPGDPSGLYSTALINGVYQLIRISDALILPPVDMGKIVVGGTLDGTLSNTDGGIGLVELGYLSGKVDVTGNIGNVILREGGGGIGAVGAVAGIEQHQAAGGGTEPDSWIIAGGTIGGVYVPAGVMRSFVQASNNPDVTTPSTIINEMENTSTTGNWLAGDLVDFNNDTQASAQFVSSTTGDFYVYGTLKNETVSAFTFTGLSAAGKDVDWYAVPMMAGQVVTIDGGQGHGANFTPFTATQMAVAMFDSNGKLVDTLGYSTINDPTDPKRGSQKPIDFTVPAAGVYYLAVYAVHARGDNYTLHVSGTSKISLGAVYVQGNYDATLLTALKAYSTASSFLDVPAVQVDNSGGLGVVMVTGSTYDVVARTVGSDSAGGDLVSYTAGIVGDSFTDLITGITTVCTDGVASDGNIGLVASTTGLLDASIVSGYTPEYDNNNAYIQNIRAATNFNVNSDVESAGSIGVIEVGGTMEGLTISINSDQLGPVAHLDLINVTQDWGGMAAGIGIPTLEHGPGSDIGYVHVDGTIYTVYGSMVAAAAPTTYTDGRTSVLNDDGGGLLTITPVSSPGGPPPAVPIIPVYSYTYIGVDDSHYPGLGVGGVIANLTVNGSVILSADGTVELSDLDLDWLPAGATVTLAGAGTADAYYVHGNAAVSSLINQTGGDVVSASFTADVTTMTLAGSLGPKAGSTGAWLFGHDVAPVSAGTATEPQYGWFHDRVNGLMVTGNLGTLSVSGSLGDVRVTGTIGTITVNSDHLVTSGEWDGINGIVWSPTQVGTIDVGSGLAPSGGADVARAGIFSGGTIGTVSIEGPRYVNDGVVFGELDGTVLAHGAGATDAITSVTGTGGAICTAMIMGANLDSFRVYQTLLTLTAGVNTVSFTGAGAEISGADIEGLYVSTVTTSANSNGIQYTTISGIKAPANSQPVGNVTGGGPGLIMDTISGNGGNLGTISTSAPTGDILGTSISGTDGAAGINTRNMGRYSGGTITRIDLPGTVGNMTETGWVDHVTAKMGAITTASVASNFTNNDFRIAGTIGAMTVGAVFNSSLVLQGPTVANLKSLTVAGDIDGTITSAGQIGTLKSTGGTISADVKATGAGAYGNVGLIQAALGFDGTLSVGGTLASFVSTGPVGLSGTRKELDVTGGLTNLTIMNGTGSAMAGNLFDDFAVGGNIGTVSIDGTLYGALSTAGNASSVTVKGGLGGLLGGVSSGDLYVAGDLTTLSLPSGKSVFADLTVGGSIQNLTLSGGSIIGNVTSLYGNIGTVSITNGSIQGDLQAVSIGSVIVTTGSITGDITATKGSITSVTVQDTAAAHGTLSSNISAPLGSIGSLSLTYVTDTAGKQIYGGTGIGTVLLNNANLASNLVSGRDIRQLSSSANGSVLGKVWAETGIGTISLQGAIQGTTVRSGGPVNYISATSLTSAILSVAGTISTLNVTGNVTGSEILPGLDVGGDYAIGGGDDVICAGSLTSFTIGGVMNNSVIAAGVGPGADGNFRTLLDNVLAPGISTIGAGTVTGGYTGTNSILAETTINAALKTAAGKAANSPGIWEGTPASTIVPGANTFGPGAGASKTTLVSGNLTLTLTGAGIALYDSVAGQIKFEQTTSSSALTIAYKTGVGAGPTLKVIGADDCPLASLTVTGPVTISTLTVDGLVGTLQVPTAAAGAVWNLPGGVTYATLTSPGTVQITAGDIGTWTMGSISSGGTFQAGAVNSLIVYGLLGANVQVKKLSSLTVQGNLTGTVASWGSAAMSVTGTLSGHVKVYCGDLTSLVVGNGLSGTVDLSSQVVAGKTYAGGKITSLYVTGGNFGGAASTFVRASGGVGYFLVSAGNFSGLLSTEGDLTTLNVSGAISGRIRTAGSITNLIAGSMSGGLVAAARNISTVTINGNVAGSWLLAGFDPGDGGTDTVFGELANMRIDAFTPASERKAANADQVLGGNILTVTIYGNMTASTVAAGINPGGDGFFGTSDDTVNGTSTIGTVSVTGAISGSTTAGESYGVFAASNMPVVKVYGGQPFTHNGNASVGTVGGLPGDLRVIGANVGAYYVTVQMNHPLDSSTVALANIKILASLDGDITSKVIVTYDAASNSIVVRLKTGTWKTLPSGLSNNFQLTLPATITDNRGSQLDGEYAGSFPSGNWKPGGDFVYTFVGV